MSSQRHDIEAQTKHIIFTVYSYFKKLSKDSSHPEVAKFFSPAIQKTSEACGISVSTIKRITSEGSKIPSGSETEQCFTTPRKTYKRTKYVTDINDSDKAILRQTVHEFYDRGEYPTLVQILSKYREKTDYKGSITSLRTILNSLKFSYRKRKDVPRFIMEQNDVVVMRMNFLRKMVNFRLNNDVRPVIYLGELEVPTGKRDQLIIFHAGSSSDGFMKDSKLVFRCKGSSEEYRTQINSVEIKDWFIQILQNLKEPSVIVVDNAWYNWVHSKNYPKLRAKRVEFSPLETSQELSKRVKQILPREKEKELNEIALSMGHEVVQLPQYHYQYNPIKLIWTPVRAKIVEHSTTLKVEDVEKLVYGALDSVPIDEWQNCVTISHNLQDDDHVKEVSRDKTFKSMVKTTNSDDGDESMDQADAS